MSTENTPNWMKYLSNAGIIFGVLLSAIGVILGGRELFSWMSTSEPLTAIVEFGPFELPPSVKEGFNKTAAYMRSSEFQEIVKHVEAMPPDSREKLTEIANALAKDDFWGTRDHFLFDARINDLSGFYRITITNNDTASLSEVQVTNLPNGLIQISNDPQKTVRDKAVVVIGKMQPEQSIVLTCWTGLEPTKFEADQIRVTHSESVATITVRAPVGRFAQYVDRYWLLCVGVIAGLSPVIVAMFTNYIWSRAADALKSDRSKSDTVDVASQKSKRRQSADKTSPLP